MYMYICYIYIYIYVYVEYVEVHDLRMALHWIPEMYIYKYLIYTFQSCSGHLLRNSM